MENERPYWHGRLSWKANFGYVFWGVVLLIAGIATAALSFRFIPILVVGIFLILIAIILFVVAVVRVISTEYFVTSHRVFTKYGIVSRKVFEIKNEWITGAMVKQGFIARSLNYGDIIISTPGQYAGSVVMIGVSDPMHVRTIVEEALRKYKEMKEVEVDLRALEKEYEYGRIDKAKYEELKAKYEEKLRKSQ
jgi:uncharacterized membrane protein YdbT with pleckstrin-like domain